MSSASMREAIVAYIGKGMKAQQIPGLSVLHSGPPFWADGSEWQINPQLGNGSVGALHIRQDSERRLTFPAPTGNKMVQYDLVLMLFYQWIRKTGTAPQNEAAWTDPLDATIDGVKAWLRLDPNAGAPQSDVAAIPGIFQQGQDPGDYKVTRDLPRVQDNKVWCFVGIEFSSYEVIVS